MKNIIFFSSNKPPPSPSHTLMPFLFDILQIDCRELRQSSPLSQVVPPKAKANLPIIFESNVKQKFQR